MKNKIWILLIVAFSFLVLPLNINAEESKYLKDYKTMNFKDTLAAEEMEIQNANYTENDEQITIYLFRGQGCSFCRSFLTFLNSISNDYGKYFKLVSYEVWYDNDNAKLMSDISTFLGEPAGGVPYIIIGNTVFGGYNTRYDDQIKEAITNEYNKSKDERYNLFEEFEKGEEGTGSSKSTSINSATVIIWNLVFIAIATSFIVINQNNKYKKLSEEISSLKSSVKKAQKNLGEKHEKKL